MIIKGIVAALGAAALLASILLGIAGAAGVCAVFWGSSILDTALGNPPQRTHPAFITFFVLTYPAMFLCAAGCVATFLVPLYTRFGIPISRWPGVANFMRRYATQLLKAAGDSSV